MDQDLDAVYLQDHHAWDQVCYLALAAELLGRHDLAESILRQSADLHPIVPAFLAAILQRRRTHHPREQHVELLFARAHHALLMLCQPGS